LTETYSLGLNVKKSFTDNFSGSIDAHYSKAEREANNGGGNQLTLIGYANRVRFQSDDAILPWVSNFASANASIFSGQQEIDGVAYQPGTTPAGVKAVFSSLTRQKISFGGTMKARGYIVDSVDIQIAQL